MLVFVGVPVSAYGKLYNCAAVIDVYKRQMYEMATGSLPFTAETPVSVALMQVNDTPTPPREINPHIPLGLEQIIPVSYTHLHTIKQFPKKQTHRIPHH